MNLSQFNFNYVFFFIDLGFIDLFMLSRESGLRVATSPEWGNFELTLRTWYNIHQNPPKLNFLEPSFCPVQALKMVPDEI